MKDCADCTNGVKHSHHVCPCGDEFDTFEELQQHLTRTRDWTPEGAVEFVKESGGFENAVRRLLA